MKTKYAHNRLILLILVSACVHAAFLYNPGSDISIPAQKESHFAVQLKTIYPKPQAKSHTRKKTRTINKPSLQKDIATSGKTASETLTQEDKTPSTSTSNAIIRSTLLSKIKTKFTKHFKYPKFAQRKGWQGKVDISFYISKQGNISDIHIKNSSGYAVLDQAAYDSLAKVKNITITDWPFNLRQKFNLPVIYKLYEG